MRRQNTRDSITLDSLQRLSEGTMTSFTTEEMTQRGNRNSVPADASADIGDPMMLLVPTTTAFLTEYRIHTPVEGRWHHFINVIASADAVETLRINGLAVDVDKVPFATR